MHKIKRFVDTFQRNRVGDKRFELNLLYLDRSYLLALRLPPRLTMTMNEMALFVAPRTQGIQAASHLAEAISTVSLRVVFVCPANACYIFNRSESSLWISVVLLKLSSC